MTPTAEDHEKDRAEAIRAASQYLEEEGLVIADLVLVSVRFGSKDDPLTPGGRDVWLVVFRDRDADSDLHPNDIPVLVDAETHETRRVWLL
jgi:hypothetical protein